MNDPVPTQICQSHNTTGENRQGLSQLLDTSFFGARPVLPEKFTRISFVGDRSFKIRTPNIGEIGLSEAEINHAIAYAIYM
jgi:hypothetical protein